MYDFLNVIVALLFGALLTGIVVAIFSVFVESGWLFLLGLALIVGGIVGMPLLDGHTRALGDRTVSEQQCTVQSEGIDRGVVQLATSCGVYPWESNDKAPTTGSAVVVSERVNGLKEIVSGQ